MPIDDTLKIKQLAGNPVPEVNPGINYVRPRRDSGQATDFQTLARTLGVFAKTTAQQVTQTRDIAEKQGQEDFYKGLTPDQSEAASSWGLGSVRRQGYETVAAQEMANADYEEFDRKKTELASSLENPYSIGTLTVAEQAEDVYARFIAESAESRGLEGNELAFYQRAMGGRSRDAMGKLSGAWTETIQAEWNTDTQNGLQSTLLTQPAVDHNGNETTKLKEFKREMDLYAQLADVGGVSDFGDVQQSANAKAAMFGAMSVQVEKGNRTNFDTTARHIKSILNDKVLTNKDTTEVRNKLTALGREMEARAKAKQSANNVSNASIKAQAEREARQYRIDGTIPKRFNGDYSSFSESTFRIVGKSPSDDDYAYPEQSVNAGQFNQVSNSARYQTPMVLPGTLLDGKILRSKEEALQAQAILGSYSTEQTTQVLDGFDKREDDRYKEAEDATKAARLDIKNYTKFLIPISMQAELLNTLSGDPKGAYAILTSNSQEELLSNTEEWIERNPNATPKDVRDFVDRQRERIKEEMKDQFSLPVGNEGESKLPVNWSPAEYREALDGISIAPDVEGASSQFIPAEQAAAIRMLAETTAKYPASAPEIAKIAKGESPVNQLTKDQAAAFRAARSAGTSVESLKALLTTFVNDNKKIQAAGQVSRGGITGAPGAEAILNREATR